MKIIKATNKTWPRHYICSGFGNEGNGCKATLEVEIEDLFKTYRQAYCEDTPYAEYLTFECPLCKALTDIDGRGEGCERQVIPNGIWDIARNKK